MQARPPLWRLFLALIVAPAIPAALLASGFWFAGSSQTSYTHYLSQLKQVALMGAYPPALMFGIHTLLLFYYGHVAPTARIVIVTGGVIASIPSLLLAIFALLESGSFLGGYVFVHLLLSLVLGLLGGAIFYLVGVLGLKGSQSRLVCRIC